MRSSWKHKLYKPRPKTSCPGVCRRCTTCRSRAHDSDLVTVQLHSQYRSFSCESSYLRLPPLFAFKHSSHPSYSPATTDSTMTISQDPAPMSSISHEDVPQDDLEQDLESLMYEDADPDHEPARAPEFHEPSPPPKRLRGAQL